MSYKVLITEDIEKEGKNYLLERGYEIKISPDISEQMLIQEAQDCDGILVRMAELTDKVISSGTKLKVISKFGVGVENINIASATKHGIQVTNSPKSNQNTVAEFTLGLMLSLAKRFKLYDKEIRKGNFQVRSNFGGDMQGKTLGIIGMGSIGELVAKKAAIGLDMKVICYKRHINTVDREKNENIELTEELDYLLKNSDFVSLHVPLTQNTRKLIGRRELSLMKPEAYIINTARGEVVDTEALADALLNNKIAGAAVDVFPGEIPSKDNPLLKLDNVILSPHAAAHTKEAMKRMSIHAAMGIHEVLSNGKTTWPVNVIGINK